jgi:hypothetical protein
VLDGHEGGADADDRRLGVAEELVVYPQLSRRRDLDSDLSDRSRIEVGVASSRSNRSRSGILAATT